jgi:hypothetical protein
LDKIGTGKSQEVFMWGQPPSASLRVCDFFEVAKNRCCKPSGYDDHIVENSKKSQTLRAGSPLFSGTKLDCFSWPRLSFGDLLN